MKANWNEYLFNLTSKYKIYTDDYISTLEFHILESMVDLLKTGDTNFFEDMKVLLNIEKENKHLILKRLFNNIRFIRIEHISKILDILKLPKYETDLFLAEYIRYNENNVETSLLLYKYVSNRKLVIACTLSSIMNRCEFKHNFLKFKEIQYFIKFIINIGSPRRHLELDNIVMGIDNFLYLTEKEKVIILQTINTHRIMQRLL